MVFELTCLFRQTYTLMQSCYRLKYWTIKNPPAVIFNLRQEGFIVRFFYLGRVPTNFLPVYMGYKNYTTLK